MKSNSIKILDCSLRDGGYVNNWRFGLSKINSIISGLISSGIEYIELGYLRNEFFDNNYSLFFIEDDFYLNLVNSKLKPCFMVDFNRIDKNSLYRNFDKLKNITLRVAFKKYDYLNALEFCTKLKEFGFDISINPMNTIGYSKSEFDLLIKKVNNIMPSSFVIVDTNGQMKKDDVETMCSILNDNLDHNISLGFHSHDNLNLSFLNAKAFIEFACEFDLILDSCLFGIGRGAGNLKTEDIAKYLNQIYLKKYNLEILNVLIQEQIMDIYQTKPWGYALQYEASANSKVHPNYANYLISSNENSIEICNKILKKIPNEYKDVYNEKIIEELYVTEKK